MEYKQPLMIANETLIGTLMKTEILTNNYTINYTNIIRRTVSDQREEMISYSDMNVQSSNIKIQSVG